MSGYRVTYEGINGEVYSLTEVAAPAGIIAGGINGLVGEMNAYTVNTLGGTGQIVTHRQVPAMEGSIAILLQANEGEGLGLQYSKLRKAFSHLKNGTLRIHTPSGEEFECQVRLNGHIPPPEVEPSSTAVARIEIPLVSDQGVWFAKEREASIEEGEFPGQNYFHISNEGETYIYPTLHWGPNTLGAIMLPSGIGIYLPRVYWNVSYSFDPASGGKVVDEKGVVEENATESLKSLLTTGVTSGETVILEYFAETTNLAKITYKWGVIDPWAYF